MNKKFKLSDKVYFFADDEKQIGYITSISMNPGMKHNICVSYGNTDCWINEKEIYLYGNQLEPKLPTVEEMNQRARRDGGEFKVTEYFEGRFFGRRLDHWNKWVPEFWHENGLVYECDDDPSIFDLIEKPKEWSVDYYVYFDASTGSIDLLTESQRFMRGINKYPENWKERRHYKRVDGKTELVLSERIGDE